VLTTADKLLRDQFITAHHLQGPRVVSELDRLIEKVHASHKSYGEYLLAMDRNVVATNVQLRHELDEAEKTIKKFEAALKKV
jgi:hypothetical protein